MLGFVMKTEAFLSWFFKYIAYRFYYNVILDIKCNYEESNNTKLWTNSES